MRRISKGDLLARWRGAGPVGLTLLALVTNGALPGPHDPPAGFVAKTEPAATGGRADSVIVLEYPLKPQNAGNLVLTVTNFGFLGNNFQDRDASMEYPKGSEVDHLIRGGIWVGGVNTSFDTLVTIGVDDGYWANNERNTEWVPVTPLPEEIDFGWIRERSTLPTSPYYSPRDAISEQDFVTGYLDTLDVAPPPDQPDAQGHIASGLLVGQESYAWSYEPADAMVLMKYTLVPTRTLSDIYFSMYAELKSGYKGNTAVGDWPPSGWFGKHRLYWVDDLPAYAELSDEPFNMVAEHHYTYDDGDAPQHAGIKLLGVKSKRSGGEWIEEDPQVAWRWWNWDPGSLSRVLDSQKYAIMAQPGIDDWSLITPTPNNSGDDPISLMSFGPWNLFSPAAGQEPDSLVISIAYLAGDNFDDLVQNAIYAQTVYRFNFTVPTPPYSPRVRIESESGRLRILWEDSPESSVDAVTSDYDFEGYRIYVGRNPEVSTFELAAQFDLTDIPAKNPQLDSYFTREWLDDELAANPDLADEQAVLDAYWPGTYTYRVGEPVPFHVTERDSVGYNTGFGRVALPESEWVTEIDGAETTVYKYAFELDQVSDGHQYWLSVTSYDLGTPETPSLESGIGQSIKQVVPGRSPGQAQGNKVTVFPNPYRGSAVWDSNRATGRFIWFAGLPSRARIKIFTLAGDLVKEIDFDGANYDGSQVAGIFPGSSLEPPILPGTMAAWDLRSHNGQPVATGLYLFSVTDLEQGGSQQGKFLILK